MRAAVAISSVLVVALAACKQKAAPATNADAAMPSPSASASAAPSVSTTTVAPVTSALAVGAMTTTTEALRVAPKGTTTLSTMAGTVPELAGWTGSVLLDVDGSGQLVKRSCQDGTLGAPTPVN